MKTKTTIKNLLMLAVFFSGMVLINACTEEAKPVEDPVASFQFEANVDNYKEYTFANFSLNAVSYAWDFGDGNTSTEESPTHTFAEDATYTVTLVATNSAGVTAERSEDIIVDDPNKLLTLLAGDDSKTWILQREEVALGIGPTAGDVQWWGFGSVTPLAERPCVLDDTYTFSRAGSFVADTKGTFFLDAEANGGWNDALGNEDCKDETTDGIFTAADGTDVSDFANGGNYTYDLDLNAQTVTVNGSGAYIGLTSKTEAGDNPYPISVKKYTISNWNDTDDVDTLQLTLVGDGFVWTFNMVSYNGATPMPDIPTDAPVFGEDLADQTPTALFNTFNSTDAADVDGLVPTESAVTITPGTDDPADANAAKVGEYVRGTADAYSDLKFALDYDCQFDNFTTVSLDVYFPSSNDYTGALSTQVDLFIADASQTQQFWTGWELFQNTTDQPKDQWITITFDLTANNTLNRTDLDMIGLKIGGENHNVDGTFYIRNFRFN